EGEFERTRGVERALEGVAGSREVAAFVGHAGHAGEDSDASGLEVGGGADGERVVVIRAGSLPIAAVPVEVAEVDGERDTEIWGFGGVEGGAGGLEVV